MSRFQRAGDGGIRRRAGLGVVAAFVAFQVGLPVSASATPPRSPSRVAGPPDRTVTWVSAGDSYSSGEGISGAGRGDDHCARSAKAYGPVAAGYLEAQRSWRIDDVLVACTGAVKADFFDAPPEPNGVNNKPQEQQAADAGMAKPDVLTLSMAGNDLGFSSVIVGCLGITPMLRASADISWKALLRPVPGVDVSVGPAGCADPDDLARFRSDLEGKIDDLAKNMAGWYQRVLRESVAADGQLVVVGYPRLFADPATWPAWRGNLCETISYGDAAMLNELTARLDERLDDAVRTADKGSGRIRYVSQIELYDRGSPRGTSRSLCGPTTTTWMNGLSTDRLTQVVRPQPDKPLPGPLMHSFHPNGLGHAAVARRVAETVVDSLGTRLEALLPPTTSPPDAEVPVSEPEDDPPIASPPAFDPGDAFHDICQVAWPTAPTRTTQAIQLTTTCQNTPGQFLFVVVRYDDPDFEISPSRSQVEVKGTIADIAESEYGYKSLIVEADEMELT